jgi:hypothetical protein
MSNTAILFRTHNHDARTRSFATRLARESGHPLVILGDETRTKLDFGEIPKVVLTKEYCREVGLYWQRDVAWCCGDYGLYLARRALPNFTRFWLIEHDVRLHFTHLSEFFMPFQDEAADLLVSDLRESDPTWFWYSAMRTRRSQIYQCLFPILRISSELIDALLRERLADSKTIVRKIQWPNDESFVATEAIRARFLCKDLNDTGRRLYHINETFSFDLPIDWRLLEDTEPTRLLYHPVVFGDDEVAARHKRVRKRPSLGWRIARRLISPLWV